MIRAVVINGSPRMEKGNTALVQGAFIEGMLEAGAGVELFYASRLHIKPCNCGKMVCWYRTPGQCCIDDDMNLLYPALRAAQIVVFATPVYIPLPGDLANIINRLCPLLDPQLSMRGGRTRALLREDTAIRTFALVCTNGWWEKANCATVVRIVRELAENSSVSFGGALLRPHANQMRRQGIMTPRGEAALAAAHQAGVELVRDGAMHRETLQAAGKALVPKKEWWS